MDFVGPINRTAADGSAYGLVPIDYATKFVMAKPFPKAPGACLGIDLKILASQYLNPGS